jgi:hypothetical protein
MDLETRQRVCELVEAMVVSGEREPPPKLLSQLKRMCKSSRDAVHTSFEQCMTQLQKTHSQRRYATVQLMDILLRRSGQFRTLVMEHLQEFMELAVGLNDLDHPLPKPTRWAPRLRQLSLEKICAWHREYGKQIKPLRLLYKHLSMTRRGAIEAIEGREQRAAEAASRVTARQQEESTAVIEKIQQGLETGSDFVEHPSPLCQNRIIFSDSG